MDKTAINLKLFILIPVFFLISLCGHSQDQKSQATERREARRIKTEQSFRDLETLLERKRFSIKLEQSLSDAWKLNMLHNLMEVDSSKWRFYYKKEYRFTERDSRNNFRTRTENQQILTKGEISEWTLTKNEKRLRYQLKFKIVLEDGGSSAFSATIESDKTATIYLRSGSSHGYNSSYTGYISAL